MNLSLTLELLDLFGGGAGSGCHGENCGRPTGSSESRRGLNVALKALAKTPDAKKLANQAIQLMSTQPIDSRLFIGKPLTKFQHAETASKWNVALYSPQNKAMYYYKDGEKSRADAKDIVHEMGHHLDYSWLKDKARSEEAKTIDEDKAARLMKSIEKEYHDARDKVLGDKSPKTNWHKVSDKGIPSGYALYNKEEWFAESFLAYFKDNARLERVAPQTHAALKSILGGELFRRKK